jgi:hypothetical protein
MRFNATLKKIDPRYRRNQSAVSARVQHIVLAQCKDFGERCAFRLFLLERHGMAPRAIVPERDLQRTNTGKRGTFT